MRRSASLLVSLLAIGCASSQPATLGVVDRKLAPCPSAPHCASTQQLDGIPPAPYVTSRDEARARLVAILRAMPGAKIVTESPDYIHAEFTSRHFHYVDDVEVYLDDRAKLAQFRSSSRSGYYDFGVNKRRLKDIREQFVAKQS